MPYIKTISEDEATGSVAANYEASKRTVGGVYETSRIISTWPELLKVEEQRYATVMVNTRSLSRMEKEAIAVAVSKRNECDYCLVHHLDAFLEAGGTRELAHLISTGAKASELPERIGDILSFALSVDPTSEPVEAMQKAGFSDDEMLEIIIIAGFFHDYNLRVNRFGLQLEDWFIEKENPA
ncbi:MAG: carboxymuconolactone decarboxylase family protein [Rhizobiaceae bacterium]